MPATTRSVAVDAATRARWAATAAPFELGLLLGQLYRSNSSGGVDAVLAAASVPSETESGVSGGFEDVSPDWVCDCAQQVDRLLPGGVGVIGLYVRAAVPHAAVFDKAAFYLRELAAGSTVDSVLYVAHVSGSEPPVFRSFTNAGNAAKTTSAASELVDVAGGLKLSRYHTMVGVSEAMQFSEGTAGDSVETAADKRAADVVAALEPFLNRARRGVCVPVEEDEGSQLVKLLAPAQSGGKKLDSKALFGSVKGTIYAMAYVCSTEEDPAQAATEYLKSDLLKTLRLRIELAREKWIDDADESGQNSFDITGRVFLPTRNALAWNSSGASAVPGPFDLSVYTFPDDDEAQVIENACEILGGLAVKRQGAATKVLEGGWPIVEHDVRKRDEKIVAARKGDPDFAPMPYHYVLICVPVALALVFLLVQNSIRVQRDLHGYDDE